MARSVMDENEGVSFTYRKKIQRFKGNMQ